MGQYTKPLLLTTPPMTGQRVVDAQYLLQGNNRHKGLAPLKDGYQDGVFGPMTAQATARAKWWCGYPEASCTPVFGQIVYEYLLPMTSSIARPLPEEYKRPGLARIAAAARTPGVKAIEYAVTQYGYEESPYGSNMQKYGAWYGFNGVPWCAVFESYCFGHTGWGSYRYASCRSIHYDAQSARNRLRVWTPARGASSSYSAATRSRTQATSGRTRLPASSATWAATRLQSFNGGAVSYGARRHLQSGDLARQGRSRNRQPKGAKR